MPTGVAVPGAKLVASNGSLNLSIAVLVKPSSPCWIINPYSYRAMPGALANPTPFLFSLIGNDAPVHGLHVFERIHVIPRVIDLGGVVSEVIVAVEVWNAYLGKARIVTAITVTGSSGIGVVDHLGLPGHFPATGNELYSIKISEEGDLAIDALVTWVFALETGTNVRILGFRAIPFAFPPNLENPIRERFGYLTDLLESFRGMEQRIQLRDTPIGSIAYSILFDDLREAQLANAILFGNQSKVLAVPRWQFRATLTAPALIGELTLFCDPQDVPFDPGALVLVWQDAWNWEAQTIQSVASDRINLMLGLRKAWPLGTAVFPLVIGRLADNPFAWESLVVGSQEIQFDVERFKP